MLRMLATLIPPDAGAATIDGLDIVRERSQVRSRIGVLSDARGLYARLTARENVRYYGRLLRARRRRAGIAHRRACSGSSGLPRSPTGARRAFRRARK